MHRRTLLIAAFGVLLCLMVITFSFFLPLRDVEGFRYGQAALCIGYNLNQNGSIDKYARINDPVTKKFHISKGDLEEFNSLKKTLMPLSEVKGCANYSRYQLFL